MKNFLFTILLLLSSLQVFSQCNIIATDTTIACGGVASLHAYTGGVLSCTDSYITTSIPYNPYPFDSGTELSLPYDDTFANAITSIPFPFTFFGVPYTGCVIGTNGNVSFNYAMLGHFDPYQINGPMPGCNSNATRNCIMAPFVDLYPFAGGKMRYNTYGTAPDRKFVIVYDSIPMYSCTSLLAVSQIVLHETTNVIDIYIKDKPTCTSSNANRSIVGIQNPSGSIFFTPPGMNPYTGQIVQVGYSFIPYHSCSFKWYDMSGGLLHTGADFSVSPTVTTSYVLKAILDSVGTVITDTSTVVVIPFTGADFVTTTSFGCNYDTVSITNTTQSVLNSIHWNFGDGTGSFSFSPPPHIYQVSGNYTITMIANDLFNCADTVSHTVDVTPSVVLSAPVSAWIGSPVTINVLLANIGSNYKIYWDNNGVIFDTTFVPQVTYTKGAGIDNITALVVNDIYATPGSSCVPITANISVNALGTSGVSNVLSTGSVIIFPNPATETINISNNSDEYTSYSICNTLGQVVQQGALHKWANALSVSSLAAGVYMVECISQYGQKEVVRMIKE
jgi:PKD repeat protein